MAQSVPSPSVYVGDLDLSVTEAMLYEHFKSCGPVVSVRVCLDSQTHKSLGYGYVNFQNPADAELAIEKLNSTKLASKFIRVSKIQRDPSLRKSGVNNIVVKRLPVEIDTPALKELFASFGKIISLRIAADESGKSRGYAYIQFENEEACDKAVAEVNNQQIEGQTITVERYSSQHRAQVMEQYTNLYIKNLSENVTDEQLRSVFGAYGTITSLKIRSDEIGRSMGFGYVAYSSHEEAAAAVAALNEKENPIAKDGAVLFVARFESKRERQRKREIAYRERQAQYAKYPNLYVKNFDDTVTAEQLKDIFERFGPTQSVKVQYDPVTKVSRGFGFVSYKDAGSAQKALQELPGSTILGPRPLFVAFALKKDARRMQFEEMQKKRMTRAMGPMGGFGGGFGGGLGSGMGNMYNQPPMGGPMGAFGQGPMGGFGGQGPMGGFGGQGPMGGFGGQGPMSMMPMRMMQPQQPRMQQPMLQQQQQQQMMMARARPMQPKPAMVAPTHVAHHQPPQQQSLPSILASMSVEQQKNVLGERLYTYITRRHPAEAAKVTGMLLEMDNAEILNLLDSPELLDAKIQEALDVLSRHSTGNM